MFRNAKFDTSELSISWEGNRATAMPFIYRLSFGTLH